MNSLDKIATAARGSIENDKAILAYALTKSLPAHDAWEMIGSMFAVSKSQAQSLINKGRRLDAQTAGRATR